jgi:Flp pilus assembly pilin Flp
MIVPLRRPPGRRELDLRGDSGATAVEYAIMVSLIALVIVGAVTYFGESVTALFELIPPHLFG